MADLTVRPSSHAEGCWVASCALCSAGWVSFARPERAMARRAGEAHMARSHPGAWSGDVDELVESAA